MKILIVGNLYPPHYMGGYELRCAQVAEALQAAGHEVQVVVSTWQPGVTNPPRSRDTVRGVIVHRILHQSAFPPCWKPRPWVFFQARHELEDARRLQKIVASFRPDVINWWSLYGLSKLLLVLPGRAGIPDISWIEHRWMTNEVGRNGEIPARFWHAVWEGEWGARALHPLLHLLGRVWEARAAREGLAERDFSRPPSHVCFVSEFMARLHREEGLNFPSTEVIHGGVPTDTFYRAPRAVTEPEALKLLYAGQVTRDRGLITVVEALGRLHAQGASGVTLHVAGDGHVAYFSEVREQIERLGLASWVRFLGKVPHDRMPELYSQHDVLVFASSRPEGLPLTMIEAMMSGCAVVTTVAGGAAEIAERARLPTFVADDPADLAAVLSRLAADRAEMARVAARGQSVARDEFSFEHMMERFKRSLELVRGDRRPE